MTTETRRDLNADLAVCDAATGGMWEIGGGKFGETNVYTYPGGVEVVSDIDYDRKADAIFIAEAREGWPEAVRRAIAAEEQVGALIELLREATDMIIPNETEYKCDYRRRYIRHQIPKIVLEVDADE